MIIKTKELQGRCSQSNKAHINNKRAAMSAAATGKALLLLATSCAAFRSGRQPLAPSATRRTQPRIFESAQYRIGRSFNGIALRYRDADGDQPIDMQMQVDMDEYLEYVEKRYSRMHQATTASRPRVVLDFHLPQKILLSTLVFCFSKTPSTTSPNSIVGNYDKKDPLQILGLSGLASAHLRQRLHASREDQTEGLFPSSRSANSLSSQADISSLKILNTFHRVTNAFVSSLATVTNFFSLRVIPELLLDKGGFSVASLALLLMVRPLLKGAFRQG